MIYLASSWKNKYYPDVLAALRAAGHEVYDFRDPCSEESRRVLASTDCECEHSSALAQDFSNPQNSPSSKGFHWTDVDPDCMNWTAKEYQRNLSHPLAEQQFDRDLEALDACDTCVLLLPCGRSAHTEAGWMAGQGKRVLVLITDQDSFEPDLMYKLFDGVCTSMDELLEALSFDPDQIMCLYGVPFPDDLVSE